MLRQGLEKWSLTRQFRPPLPSNTEPVLARVTTVGRHPDSDILTYQVVLFHDIGYAVMSSNAQLLGLVRDGWRDDPFVGESLTRRGHSALKSQVSTVGTLLHHDKDCGVQKPVSSATAGYARNTLHTRRCSGAVPARGSDGNSRSTLPGSAHA